MTHRTLDKLELEDMISYAEGAGNFRFDIKWSAKRGFDEISIFIDTKNYGSAGNMFKDLNQVKAYLQEIDNFDQLYIIQQGGRGVEVENMMNAFQKAVKKDAEGVFNANKKLWEKNKIPSADVLKKMAENDKLKPIIFKIFKTTD